MEDEYVVEDISDDDYNSSSSEDDLQNFIKRECGLIEVEDDFETEMDKVMTAHMKKMRSFEPEATTEEATASTSKDSDDKSKKVAQSDINDELLYDPDMDDEDEKWVAEKRRSYIFPTKESSKPKVKPLPNSDAVLNCPACLSLLCMDCQRHAMYKSQYRAMFVSNCTVIESETLRYPNKKKNFKKKPTESVGNNDIYNPVHCSVCNTEVAVYDTDEVFHFFNVLASY